MTTQLPTVTDDMQIWERMPWDTAKSYRMFLTYYFPQSPPRSINKAYRDATPLRRKPPVDNRVAPSNWRRWAQGRGKGDKRLQYRLLHEDGREEVLPVPSWQQRAEAWDRGLVDRALAEAEKVRTDQLDEMRKMLRLAFFKTFSAWNSYTPGGESLGTLTASTSRLFADLQAVYGDLLPDPDAKAAESENEPDINPENALTDMDRVDAIARILDKVRTARENEKGNATKST